MHPTCPQQPLLPAKIPTFHMWQCGRGSGKWGPGWTQIRHPLSGLKALYFGPALRMAFINLATTGRGLWLVTMFTVANEFDRSRVGRPGETRADCCRPEWVERPTQAAGGRFTGLHWPLPPESHDYMTTCRAPMDTWHLRAYRAQWHTTTLRGTRA